ncbi:MAG: hypothetical protein CBB71_22760 [Rhodopirellula sp. TMED11]|nr:MAG: hypothetical protein CBB71_22760 [Rhodopirellula sp. TMED11]
MRILGDLANFFDFWLKIPRQSLLFHWTFRRKFGAKPLESDQVARLFYASSDVNRYSQAV